ncbi:MAG: hypothetical protein ABIF11_02465 [Nitrospirota bacterium]
MLVPPKDYNPESFWGVGIITLGAKKIIPLSKRTCLVMADYGGGISIKEIDRKGVTSINLTTAINSDRFLIARDKPLLEKIVKLTKVNRWTKKSRVQVS